MRRRGICLLCGLSLASALVLAACGGGSDSSSSGERPADSVQGAGSALVAPLMAAWRSGFEREAGGNVTFRSVGRGIDLSPVTVGNANFGVTDAPVTPKQFREGKGVAMVPWALTGVAIVYNLRNGPKHLRLDRDVLAGILLGKVIRWNDPAIAKLNPGAQLPDTPIIPILRSDENAEDYDMSDYLSIYKGAYGSRFGVSRELHRAITHTGRTMKGEVSAAIAKTDGSIGYVALQFARERDLDIAELENPAGRFVLPTRSSLVAGAEAGISVGPNTEIWLRELPKKAKTAYPLVAFSYGVLPFDAKPPIQAELKKLVGYVTGHKAQATATSLDFAPLPENLVKANERTLRNIYPNVYP